MKQKIKSFIIFRGPRLNGGQLGIFIDKPSRLFFKSTAVSELNSPRGDSTSSEVGWEFPKREMVETC